MELQKIISFAAAMSLSAQLWAQGEVITLQHLWDDAERNSTSIKVMKSELDAANLAVEAVKSGNLPDLNASLSIGYLGDGVLTDRNFKNSLHVDNPHFMNSFAVQASQLIYGGGTVKNAVKTAESGRNIATLNLESERQCLSLKNVDSQH
ncbi:MAG: TolC family protein [Bacteroidales bacterium]|nr:TolC family protein [Bacteroidales bacterium]